MRDKEQIKIEILSLLKEAPTKEYIYISSYFGDVDYFLLKQISEEMTNTGLVTYDVKAWRNDQIALKISTAGNQYLTQSGVAAHYEHRVRQWLQVGVLGGMMFLMAFAVVSYFPGMSDQQNTVFRAELSLEEKNAVGYVKKYLTDVDENPENYTISLAGSEDERKNIIIVCKKGKQCPYYSRYFLIEQKNGNWEIVDTKILR